MWIVALGRGLWTLGGGSDWRLVHLVLARWPKISPHKWRSPRLTGEFATTPTPTANLGRMSEDRERQVRGALLKGLVALLAIALDALDRAGWGVPEAAAALGCTASQLLKLLREEPRAFAMLKAGRSARGLPPPH